MTLIIPGEEADFLNKYFCHISQRLGLYDPNPDLTVITRDLEEIYGDVNDVFDLTNDVFTVPEFVTHVNEIDVFKSSCVPGIKTSICKDIMLKIPDDIVYMFNCTLTTGIFPNEWSKGYINVIPKTGKLSDPSNWRPITQTPIFAKILEKLVHSRLLHYFEENNILSKYQYGFRPNRSTQQSVFELIKFIYSGLNNKKLIPAVCLDVCKAFDCINHKILLAKMEKNGFSVKDTLWVSAPSTSGLCVFPHIFVVYASNLTRYIPNES